MKSNGLSVEVINKYFYPVAAGIETNTLEVYSNMAKNGWNVTIHTSKNTLTEKDCLKREETIRGLKVKRYYFGNFGFFPEIDWKKTKCVALHNFNIFPHLFLLLYCLVLKILGRKEFKVFLTPHGFTPYWSQFPKWLKVIKKIYQDTLGIFLINAVVDGVRAVSDWEKDEIIARGVNPKLVETISNGIENEAFINLEKFASHKIKTTVQQNQSYIIQIGRIHPIKNYETSIKALAKLPKKLNYLIVGPDQDLQYKKELEKLIKKLKLQDRVKFLGVVTGADKYYLLKNATMMVHMAHWEAYCNTVHEGMSQGLVCVVPRNTALEELIKNGVNGYCLDPDDYKGLVEKINFVLKNKNSTKILEMKKRNKDFAAGHSWKNVAKEVEIFYKNVSESSQSKTQKKFLKKFAALKHG